MKIITIPAAFGFSTGKVLKAAFLLAALAALTGCANLSAIPRDPAAPPCADKCYIENEQFIYADQQYSRLGSLALVDEHLRREVEWRDCQVNEALYRLRKIHDLP